MGPPASAMRAMGSKWAAKALMETSEVSLLPGYHGDGRTRIFSKTRRCGRFSGGDQGGLGRRRPGDAGSDCGGGVCLALGRPAGGGPSVGDDRVLVERGCSGLGTSRFRCLPIRKATRCTVRAGLSSSADIRRCSRKRRRLVCGSSTRGHGGGCGRCCSRGRLCRGSDGRVFADRDGFFSWR